MAIRLNLGCGGRPERGEGWINHDRYKHSDYVDVWWDLENVVWPHLYYDTFNKKLSTAAYGMVDPPGGWERLFCDELKARDVLEHISPSGFYDVMNAAWAILKPGGVFNIQVPQHGSENAAIDPTHWRGFHLLSFDYLDPDTDIGRRNFWCTPFKWRVVDKRVLPRSNVNLAFVLEKRDPS